MSKPSDYARLDQAAAARGWAVREYHPGANYAHPMPRANRSADEDTPSVVVEYQRPADWPPAMRSTPERIVARFHAKTRRLLGADVFDGPKRRLSAIWTAEHLAADLNPPAHVWAEATYVPPRPEVNPSVGVENIHGALQLTFRPPGAGPEMTRYVFDPAAALDFARRVMSEALTALADTIGDLTAGPCPTCRGRRLVQVERHAGQLWDEHCPDCHPKVTGRRPVDAWLEATFPVSGGAALIAEHLAARDAQG